MGEGRQLDLHRFGSAHQMWSAINPQNSRLERPDEIKSHRARGKEELHEEFPKEVQQIHVDIWKLPRHLIEV